jgi:RF-1 domain
MTRELAFSVTKKDLVIDTFTAGGPGGQNVNRSNTAVRITHPASGASGVARDSRSQHQNMKNAMRRMTEDPKFRIWVNRKLLGNPLPPEEQVKRDMAPENLIIYGYDENGKSVILE